MTYEQVVDQFKGYVIMMDGLQHIETQHDVRYVASSFFKNSDCGWTAARFIGETALRNDDIYDIMEDALNVETENDAEHAVSM